MKNLKSSDLQNESGFSLLELLISMTMVLVLFGLVFTLLTGAFSTQNMETQRTFALNSAQSSMSMISREVANSGFGLNSNGLVLADCNAKRIHFRTNVENNDLTTNSPGEDVTFFYDATSQSIVRYDVNANPQTSVVIDQVSDVNFTYFNYTSSGTPPTQTTTPTANTAKILVTVTVLLEDVQGQPQNQTVTYTSEITLRNSEYMLESY